MYNYMARPQKSGLFKPPSPPRDSRSIEHKETLFYIGIGTSDAVMELHLSCAECLDMQGGVKLIIRNYIGFLHLSIPAGVGAYLFSWRNEMFIHRLLFQK